MDAKKTTVYLTNCTTSKKPVESNELVVGKDSLRDEDGNIMSGLRLTLPISFFQYEAVFPTYLGATSVF